MVSQKGDIDADQVIGREAFVGFMMENPADYYYGVLWNKLYRRSLVEAHGIRMDAIYGGEEQWSFHTANKVVTRKHNISLRLYILIRGI